MKNKKGFGWLLWLFILLIILLVVMFIVRAMNTNPNAPPPPNDTSWKVECQVKIDDSVFHPQGMIEGVTCDRTSKCGLFEMMPVEIFQSGHVRLKDAATQLDKKDWQTYPFFPDEVTLRGCTKYNSITIMLYDESDNKIDEQEVDLT